MADCGHMLRDALNGLALPAIAVATFILPFLVFGLLERIIPAGPAKSVRGWLLNAKIAAAYIAVPTLLGGLFGAVVAASRHLSGGGLIDLAPVSDGSLLSTATAVVIFMLVFDFFYYWWHRLQHGIPALWSMHKVHHLDESLGVSTQLRCHWLEEVGRLAFIFIPMGFIFNLPMHTGVVATVITVWTAFIHSNLRLGLGWANAFVATPQGHRIHHSVEERHHNRNYAALFPFFDVIFGTYYHPARDEYPQTGVHDEHDVHTASEAALLPFHGLLARLKTSRR